MIFDITDEDMFNKNLIKVIDGIAGSAKSSKIDAFFSGHYNRYTSTVRLMKDAQKRFGCRCDTIAGGLFTTEKGHFFVKFREPETETVVIDEILQTSPRVLEWCKAYVGTYNIVITTDSRQMLPKQGGEKFLEKFKTFCKEDFVIYRQIKKTYRAVNKETEELYNILYDNVENDDENMFERYKHLFRQINYEDMPFLPSCVYITHSNDDEEYLYIDKDISNRSDLDIIPKGCIAKKNFDPSRHVVLCQNAATRLRTSSYGQSSNIGSTTRFQGSQVEVGQTCFNIISKNSRECNREFYTNLTRCKDMKDFVIVYRKNGKKKRMSTFCGMQIKDEKVLSLSSDDVDASIIKDGMIDGEAFNNILSINISPEFAYNSDVIYIDGKKYHRYTEEKIDQGKFNLRTLLKKEPNFDFDMEEVYKVLDKNGILFLDTPHISNVGKNKDDNRYYLDLFSAYPHILSHGLMPKNSVITFEESPRKLNFYYIDCPEFPGKIVTGDLGAMLYDKFGHLDMLYLFSLDYTKGCKMGKILEEAATRSVESKAEVKKVLWGILEKKYLDWMGYFDADMSHFHGTLVRKEYNRYGILMVGILSELYKVMIDLSMIEDGYICVDALHFNDEKSIPKLIEKMKQDYPFLRYRIVDKKDGSIVYKNYKDLMTEADIKKAQARERQRRRREKLKKEK